MTGFLCSWRASLYGNCGSCSIGDGHGRCLISTPGSSALPRMWRYWYSDDPRDDGLPAPHRPGQPGLRGPGLGEIRCGLQASGGTDREQEVVSDQYYPVLDVFHRQGYTGPQV